MCLVSLGVAGASNNDSRRLGSTATAAIGVTALDAAGTSGQATVTGFTTSTTWYALVGEFAGTASRRVIRDGVVGSNATAITLTSAPNQIRIGNTANAAQPFSGVATPVGIFAGTASDSFIALHRQGIHPTQLPGQLLECWDLDRIGPVAGLVRGTVLEPTNGGELTAGPTVQGSPVARRFYVGATGGGATSYSITGSGGFALSGAAGIARHRVLVGTGGLSLAGVADIRRMAVLVAQGSLTFSGAATITSSGLQSYAYTGSGGLVLSGTGAIVRAQQTTGSGGYALSGSSLVARVRAVMASGGLTLSGEATVLRSARQTASGGIVLSGAAVITAQQGLQIVGDGGVVLSGAALIVRRVSLDADGGLTFTGTALIQTSDDVTYTVIRIGAVRTSRTGASAVRTSRTGVSTIRTGYA